MASAKRSSAKRSPKRGKKTYKKAGSKRRPAKGGKRGRGKRTASRRLVGSKASSLAYGVIDIRRKLDTAKVKLGQLKALAQARSGNTLDFSKSVQEMYAQAPEAAPAIKTYVAQLNYVTNLASRMLRMSKREETVRDSMVAAGLIPAPDVNMGDARAAGVLGGGTPAQSVPGTGQTQHAS